MTKKPSYRFVVYTEPWEQRKLGDVSTITMGQSPNSENYTDNPNDSILVQGNADMKNGRVFPRVWTTQITKQARQGDLILSVRAPVGDIGKTDYDVVLGRGVASIDGNEFLYQALSQMKQNGYWSKLSTGSTFESINSNDIKSAIISLPSLPEQTAIGSFFQDIDQLISLQQRKLEVLKEQKKTYLKLLFPSKGQTKPALRFAGFEDEWKEVKLGEIADYKNGKGYEDRQSDSGSYELINLNSISIDGGLKRSGKFIDKADETLEKGDLVMVLSDVAHGNLLGRVAIIPESNKFVLNQRVALLRPRLNSNSEFLYSYINSNQYYFKAQGAGMSQLNISRSSVENFSVYFPSLPEQEVIGSFFQDLDKAIAKQEEKVSQLKESKQTLLRKMFI
jgi:type I R/M system specificity subunit